MLTYVVFWLPVLINIDYERVFELGMQWSSPKTAQAYVYIVRKYCLVYGFVYVYISINRVLVLHPTFKNLRATFRARRREFRPLPRRHSRPDAGLMSFLHGFRCKVAKTLILRPRANNTSDKTFVFAKNIM